MVYSPTITETLISEIMKERGFIDIFDLTISNFLEKFHFEEVHYAPINRCCLYNENGYRILILSDKLDYIGLYETMLHEIAHFIYEDLSYTYLEKYQWQYCELKVDNMVQYLAMPYFMIDTIFNLQTVSKISQYFHVSKELAMKRIENIRNRMSGENNAAVQGQENGEMVLPNKLYGY